MEGPQLTTILNVQQLRGQLEHFQATNEVWKLIKGPTDALLGCHDEKGRYVRPPDPEVWHVFLGSHVHN